MARMPVGQPRSVPDPHGDDYDKMMREWMARSGPETDGSAGPAASPARRFGRTPPVRNPLPHPAILQWANPPAAAAQEAMADLQEMDPVGPPGLMESFIPVEGSGREAVNDLQTGDYFGAGLNGVLAATDLIPAKEVAGALGKGAFKLGGSHTWNATRKWMGNADYLAPFQHGHHWGIPNKEWGKVVPDWIKNQPWNIKPMPSAEVHGLIHGPYKKQPRFNLAQQLWHGTPRWAKAAGLLAVGDPIAAAWEASKQDQNQ